MATPAIPKSAPPKSQPVVPKQDNDWTNPAAMAIPKEGYFKVEQGTYGPIFPRTPACYGFTIIAKVKPGREAAMRAYANTVEMALQSDPSFLAPLKLHYLKWVLFDIGNDKYFMYQGIFDTDFGEAGRTAPEDTWPTVVVHCDTTFRIGLCDPT